MENLRKSQNFSSDSRLADVYSTLNDLVMTESQGGGEITQSNFCLLQSQKSSFQNENLTVAFSVTRKLRSPCQKLQIQAAHILKKREMTTGPARR